MVLQVVLWCLHDEDLEGFSGDSEVHVAIPWVPRKHPTVPKDLKLTELIVVERREFVVHESVAKRDKDEWIKLRLSQRTNERQMRFDQCMNGMLMNSRLRFSMKNYSFTSFIMLISSA